MFMKLCGYFMPQLYVHEDLSTWGERETRFRKLAFSKTKHNSPGRGGSTRKPLKQKFLDFLVYDWAFTSRALYGEACSTGNKYML